jgi:hypothetical protein
VHVTWKLTTRSLKATLLMATRDCSDGDSVNANDNIGASKEILQASVCHADR